MRSFFPPRSGSADRKSTGRPRRPAIGPRPVQAPQHFAGAGREAATAPAADGLPERLQTVMEAMSGFSLADVVVHRNSAEPARLGADAIAQGNRIHLAPGQERHLPHEAWHVVQQKQGRVRPTLRLGDAPINCDPGLEAEADRMGHRAQGAPDRAAAAARRAPPTSPAIGSPPPIQGAWRAIVDGSRSRYFWVDEGEAERPEPPAIWATEGYERLDEAPDPRTYYFAEGSRQKRGPEAAFKIDQWLTTHARSTRAPSDRYNPFGRFATSSIVSFVPGRGLSAEAAQEVHRRLDESDATYQPVSQTLTNSLREKIARDEPGTSFENAQGYPVMIATGQGTILHFVSADEFGAVYSDVRPAQSHALLNLGPAASGSSPDSSQDAQTAVSDMDEEEGPGSAIPEHVDSKQARARNIDPDTIKAWQGRKREKQQYAVMGASAAEVAADAGFDPDEGEGWQWLHLIAHGMGGIDLIGPQVADNLVAGTSECNTQMIIVEDFLKDLVLKTGGRAELWVGVAMLDAARHIGQTIHYDFVITYGHVRHVYHYAFDCLSRTRPLVAQNRITRYVGRAVHARDAEEEEGEDVMAEAEEGEEEESETAGEMEE